ncbi:hypothetical protein QIS74_05556 [Colletotrichum tabaci]|uniref:Uncharacterized protein n=1 Tax=Colletotrichum tabaci TaxID=1209068 RepID=A0AAV9TH63_9PEZI
MPFVEVEESLLVPERAANKAIDHGGSSIKRDAYCITEVVAERWRPSVAAVDMILPRAPTVPKARRDEAWDEGSAE